MIQKNNISIFLLPAGWKKPFKKMVKDIYMWNQQLLLGQTNIIYHFLKFDRFILIWNFIYGEENR